jgi:hypothetical protein
VHLNARLNVRVRDRVNDWLRVAHAHALLALAHEGAGICALVCLGVRVSSCASAPVPASPLCLGACVWARVYGRVRIPAWLYQRICVRADVPLRLSSLARAPLSVRGHMPVPVPSPMRLPVPMPVPMPMRVRMGGCVCLCPCECKCMCVCVCVTKYAYAHARAQARSFVCDGLRAHVDKHPRTAILNIL